MISSPMKTRMGATAASGSTATSAPSTPSDAPMPITSPVGQRVAGARAHRLVGRMADVRRVLAHAAAEPGEHGGQRLGQQHVARAVLVAGRRALSVLSIPPMIVTSANGSAIDRYGSVVAQRVQPRQRRPRDREPTSADGHRRRWRRPPSAARPQKIAVPASTAAKAPGTPSGIRTPPQQRQQQHDEGDQTHQRVAQDLQHRQEGDQQDGHAGDRAEERGARHHAPGPVARERERHLRQADGDRHGHADLPRAAPGRRWRASPGRARRRPSRRASACRCRTASR